MNSLIIFIILPIITSFILCFINNSLIMKQIALLGSCLIWLNCLYYFTIFDLSDSGFQFISSFSSYGYFFNFNIIFGMDSISLFLLLLTTLLFPLCFLSSWITQNSREYYIAFLILESLLLGVFLVLDIFYFYILFEGVLIPMYLIIGIWGSRSRKILASYQFFIYTLLGSLFMLISIIYIYYTIGSTDYILLSNITFDPFIQKLLWIGLFMSFATKIPMIPVHIWLPEAHVEAPTAGSVILAGILLKLGSYGFLRYSLIFFPDASLYFSPLIYTLSLLGILYASLTTLRQIDLKKIIAYSSIAHMSFVTLGLFSFSYYGLLGSYYLMLSHGFISSALFFLIGILYDRFHTRLLPYYGSLSFFMPLFSFSFLFFSFANLSFPGTASFIGEFLVLLSLFIYNPFIGILSSIGIILGALYSIWLANRLLFGLFPSFFPIGSFDLTLREFSFLFPLFLLTLFMGFFPSFFSSFLSPSFFSFFLLLLSK